MATKLQLIHDNDNITILSYDKRILTIVGLLNIKTEDHQ
jgi:hypothetical protein